MQTKTITLLMDGKIPIETDEETFSLVKLMVKEADAMENRHKAKKVVQRFMDENLAYQDRRGHVISLVTMARHELIEEAHAKS